MCCSPHLKQCSLRNNQVIFEKEHGPEHEHEHEHEHVRTIFFPWGKLNLKIPAMLNLPISLLSCPARGLLPVSGH
jgi:hypothetical protein